MSRSAKYRFTAPGRCRWCGSPPKPPRRSWCSEACVEEYRVRAWPAHARQKVWRRDGGVCAACGIDTAALRRRMEHTAELPLGRPFEEAAEASGRLAASRWLSAELWDELSHLGWSARRLWRRGGILHRFSLPHLWEADHIVPVERGGGGCGIDNLQTLCVPCHAAKTARQAAERATQRRAQQELPLEGDA